ncbi:MAG: hypothetical protein OHK0028_10920 [Deltaproteobacteria bacterium]
MSEDRPICPGEGPGIGRQETSRIPGTLVDTSPLAVVAYDPDGVVTLWNPAAEKIFGWTAEEAIGARLPFVQAEKQEEFRALCARALRGEAFTERELHRRRADGSPIVVRASISPLRRADGSIRGILSILIDTTDRDAAEDAEEMRRIAGKVHEALEPA